MIYLFQLFNEAILRPTAIILDLLIRVPLALYGGFRAVILEMGAANVIASVIVGFIVTGILLGTFWLFATSIQKFRMKNPSRNTLMVGTVTFWVGCAIGVYFLCLTFYALGQSEIPGKALYFIAGTAALFPALGRLIRFILGR